MSGRDIAIVAAIVIGALILLPVLGGGMMMSGWGMPHMVGGPWAGRGWGMPLFGGLFGLLLIAGIVLVIVALARRPGPAGGAEETPLEILKRRLARGEISREEYETLKKEVS